MVWFSVYVGKGIRTDILFREYIHIFFVDGELSRPTDLLYLLYQYIEIVIVLVHHVIIIILSMLSTFLAVSGPWEGMA